MSAITHGHFLTPCACNAELSCVYEPGKKHGGSLSTTYLYVYVIENWQHRTESETQFLLFDDTDYEVVCGDVFVSFVRVVCVRTREIAWNSM